MENQNPAVAVLIVLVLALLAVIVVGSFVIAPNSVGVPGLVRGFVLKTTHLAFSCEKQAGIGADIYTDESIEPEERAARAREWFNMALSCKAPAANYFLGDMYLNGYGVRKNVDKGLSYLLKAKREGHGEASWLLASSYHRGRNVPVNLEQAAAEYEACAADQGNPRATECGAGLAQLLVLNTDPPQYALAYERAAPAAEGGIALGQAVAAYLLYSGLGVERDVERARVWAESAAAQGEPFAYGTLAEIYLRGDGVPADTARGLGYVEQLEEIDAPWANRQLGYFYRDGVGGLAPDPEKAVGYFISAAQGGDRKAANEAGKHLYESIGADGDFAEAFRWLTRAAAEGDGTATLYLSRLYFDGVPQLRIAPSRDKGWLYLNRADTQGAIAAKADLARLFYEGEVVTRSDKEALRYAEAGATAGHARSQAWLGFFLLEGIGTDKDETRALEWLEKATAQGDTWAQYQLAESYFHGLGVAPDRVKARALFEHNFEAGNIDAAIYLGYYFEHALVAGDEVDLARAHAYYEFATRKGSARGAEALQRTDKTISAADLARSETLLAEIESAWSG